MTDQRAAIVTLLAVSVLAQGCATRLPATAPIRTVEIGPMRGQTDTLVVMLPGIRDDAEKFIVSGFIDGHAEDAFDLLAVDAHWGYYADGSIVERLHDDVIVPARARGYRRIWLLGISLGGFGALLYMDRFPEDIHGAVLLAPYLGDHSLAGGIIEAGGLVSWSGTPTRTEPFEEGWRSLQKLASRNYANVILGYGDTDDLVANYAPLLEVLPSSQVHTVAGGHDWRAWALLWAKIKKQI